MLKSFREDKRATYTCNSWSTVKPVHETREETNRNVKCILIESYTLSAENRFNATHLMDSSVGGSRCTLSLRVAFTSLNSKIFTERISSRFESVKEEEESHE